MTDDDNANATTRTTLAQRPRTAIGATRSVVLRPWNSKCSYWALVATPEEVLAADLKGAGGMHSLPGTLARKGSDHELPAWTVVLRGEAVHPTKHRGWNFCVSFILPVVDADSNGEPMNRNLGLPGTAQKAAIKASGAQHLMLGSGPHAAMLRAAKWVLEAEGDDARLARVDALMR